MTFRLFSLLFSIFSLTFSVFLSAEDRPPPLVEIQKIQQQNYARPVRTSGILSYKSRQTLSFKTAGPIEKISVDEGDRVTEDTLLAQLEMTEINARVKEASARLTQAQRNLDRFKKLHSSNALSLDNLQAAETEVAVAESQLSIARFNQQYSRILAPANGLILRRHADENEQVSPNQPILELADETQGWVMEAGVTDEEIIRLKKQDKVAVTFDALPGTTISGKISQLAALADEATGTFTIEVSIPAENPLLRAGFVGEIAVIPEQKQQLTLIPAMSIVSVENQHDARVFIFDPAQKTVQLKPVSVAFISQDLIGVSNGLNEGDLLITTGAGLLRDGQTVRISDGVR